MRRGRFLVWAMAGAYALLFSAISIVKYRYYLYTDFDLAIFAQATDRILHGSFDSSISGLNLLGAHSALILILLAPIYALFHHPVTLLVIQSAALALGAIPVYRLAARELGHGFAPVAFAALYLAFPALGHLNLFEFHPEALATPALLFAFEYGWSGRTAPMAAAAAVAALGREDAAFVIGMLGLSLLAAHRPRAGRSAAALGILAAASLLLTFGVLQPRFATGEVEYIRMYQYWGSSLGEVARNVVSHPLKVVQWLLSTPGDAYDSHLKQQYYLQMLLPLLFLSILSPTTLLIAAPVLVEHFLSWRITQHMILYQYAALVIPFVVMAAVLGYSNLLGLAAGRKDARGGASRAGPARWIARWVPALALLASFVSNLWFGPLLAIGGRRIEETPQRFWPAAADRERLPYRDRMVARVSPGVGAVAGFEFLARLSSRANLQSLHHLMLGTWTFSTKPYPVPGNVSALIGEPDQPRYLGQMNLGTGPRLRQLIAGNGLRIADSAGGLMLYLRDDGSRADSIETWAAGAFPIASPRRLLYDRAVAYLGCELVSHAVPPGGLLPVRTFWKREGAVDRLYITQYLVADRSYVAFHDANVSLGYAMNPVHLWPDTVPVRMTYRMIVPPDTRPGRYLLGMRVLSWDGEKTSLAGCDDPGLPANQMMFLLGVFDVTPGARR